MHAALLPHTGDIADLHKRVLIAGVVGDVTLAGQRAVGAVGLADRDLLKANPYPFTDA